MELGGDSHDHQGFITGLIEAGTLDWSPSTSGSVATSKKTEFSSLSEVPVAEAQVRSRWVRRHRPRDMASGAWAALEGAFEGAEGGRLPRGVALPS